MVGKILKILGALTAIAGAVYVAATYGDKIVEWAKSLCAKCGCCKCCGEEPAAEEVTEEPAEAVEEACEACEEAAEEVCEACEEAAEEVCEACEAAEEAPVAEESDFEA